MQESDHQLTRDQINDLLDSLRRFYSDFDAVLDVRVEDRFLAGFRDLLADFHRDTDTQARQLALECFDLSVPFALLMASFNHVKQDVVKMLACHLPDPLKRYATIARRFEHARRVAARAFLVAEVSHAAKLPLPVLHERILIRLILDWMQAVREAIQGDFGSFPLQPAGESEFAQALRYPESMMICLDLKLCDQIEEQHRLMVRQAGILHALLVAGRFEQAYLAWQDLDQQASKLLQTLGALYLEAQTNYIDRFFSFVQASLYLPGRKFLCVINLQKLERINALYGTEVGNRALASVEAVLREMFERHREWLLYTRGIAGDFYLLGQNVSTESMCELLTEIEQRSCGTKAGTDLPVDLQLSYLGIELTGISELSTEDMHLVIQYLTKRARQQGPALETSREAVESMLDWLREHYRKVLDLRERLTEESTDIFIQPLVTLDESRDIHAFEVLGRFRTENGYISAGLFIDDIIAMRISPLFDKLVLKAVIRQARSLRRITSRLFINVSAASLAQQSYVDQLVNALHGPLREFDVVMELTEQVLLEHRDLVRRLKTEYGLAFAIDDFGTGYSTLQTVIELALDGSVSYLKMDGSLTRQLDTSEASERIMQITRQMARELNLVTVVEFIETNRQAEKLEALKMDLGQGYLLGVPDPVPVWQGKLVYLKSRAHPPGESGFSL